jgi:hypothetical protein
MPVPAMLLFGSKAGMTQSTLSPFVAPPDSTWFGRVLSLLPASVNLEPVKLLSVNLKFGHSGTVHRSPVMCGSASIVDSSSRGASRHQRGRASLQL